MRARFGLVTGVAALAALATGLLTAPVHAAPAVPVEDLAADTYLTSGQGKSSCPSGRLCLYKDVNYNADGSAPILVTRVNVSWLGDYQFNDAASSYYNNTSQPAVLHEHVNYGGGQLSIRSQGSGNLGTWNDKASSLQFLS
ncbi:peptidase inhibitor family I36 protein [Kitasatospora sp. NPDC005856]|uniref:peptidase inhibitor family I36 protein n=1 Tax=Kitasatospora sp. NPDC005856 TaxID=3154566 RepID=UPI0033DBA5BF